MELLLINYNIDLVLECLREHPEKINRNRNLDLVEKRLLKGHETPPSLSTKAAGEADPVAHAIFETRHLDVDSEQIFQYHHFIMQIEKTVGDLVERYIAAAMYKTSDWAYCPAEVVSGTDFIRKTDNGWYFLNVKNKYNSENSSSKKARLDKGVDLWFRLNRNGSYNWNEFPDPSLGLSEEGFLDFVCSYTY